MIRFISKIFLKKKYKVKKFTIAGSMNTLQAYEYEKVSCVMVYPHESRSDTSRSNSIIFVVIIYS